MDPIMKLVFILLLCVHLIHSQLLQASKPKSNSQVSLNKKQFPGIKSYEALLDPKLILAQSADKLKDYTDNLQIAQLSGYGDFSDQQQNIIRNEAIQALKFATYTAEGLVDLFKLYNASAQLPLSLYTATAKEAEQLVGKSLAGKGYGGLAMMAEETLRLFKQNPASFNPTIVNNRAITLDSIVPTQYTTLSVVGMVEKLAAELDKLLLLSSQGTESALGRVAKDLQTALLEVRNNPTSATAWAALFKQVSLVDIVIQRMQTEWHVPNPVSQQKMQQTALQAKQIILDAMGPAETAISQVLTQVVSLLGNVLSLNGTILQPILGQDTGILGGVLNLTESAISVVLNTSLLTDTLGLFLTPVSELSNYLSNVTNVTLFNLSSLDPVNSLTDLASFAVSLLDLNNLVNIVTQATTNLPNLIGNTITQEVDNIGLIVQDILSLLTSNGLTNLIGDVANGIANLLNNTLSSIPIVGNLLSGLGALGGNLTSAVTGILGSLTSTIGNTLTNGLGSLTQVLNPANNATDAASQAANAAGDVVDQATDAATNIVDQATDVVSDVTDAVTNTTADALDTITDAASQAADALNGIVNQASDAPSNVLDGLDSSLNDAFRRPSKYSQVESPFDILNPVVNPLNVLNPGAIANMVNDLSQTVNMGISSSLSALASSLLPTTGKVNPSLNIPIDINNMSPELKQFLQSILVASKDTKALIPDANKLLQVSQFVNKQAVEAANQGTNLLQTASNNILNLLGSATTLALSPLQTRQLLGQVENPNVKAKRRLQSTSAQDGLVKLEATKAFIAEKLPGLEAELDLYKSLKVKECSALYTHLRNIMTNTPAQKLHKLKNRVDVICDNAILDQLTTQFIQLTQTLNNVPKSQEEFQLKATKTTLQEVMRNFSQTILKEKQYAAQRSNVIQEFNI